MKIKSNLKILVLIVALLLTMCIFNASKVKAATIDEIKVAIPDELTIDVKESEFQKLFGKDGLIYKELSKKIDLSGYEYEVHTVGQDSEYIDIHNFGITLRGDNNAWMSKEFKVVYNNTKNYNEKDKQKVENFMNKYGSYYYYETRDCTTGGMHDGKITYESWDFVESAYQDIIDTIMKGNTDNIKCLALNLCRSMGGEISFTLGTMNYYFINDVFYGSKLGEFSYSYDIVVPDNVPDTETDYINYAKNYLKNELGYTDELTITYDKNIGQYRVVIEDAGNEGDWVHIAKKDVAKIHDGITVNSDATFSVETIKADNNLYKEMQKMCKEKGYTNVVNAYELNIADGKIGTNGLTIKFDLGVENNGKKAIVVHRKHDGNYEVFEKNVVDGRISIVVNELSPFLIALGDATETKPTETKPTETKPTETKPLDDEPKTGVVNYTIFASIISLISLGGIAIIKFKK